MKSGKFILVTGYFGAGKSSLVNSAIRQIPNLIYLKTITTRSKRGDEKPGEYNFVTLEKYMCLKEKSKIWDHSEIADNYYGADVSEYNKLLLEGKNVICCIAPDVKIIEQMSGLYAVRPILVWVDTKLSIANKRLVESKIKARVTRKSYDLQTEKNANRVKSKIDQVFTPLGDLEEDKLSFVDLIQKLLK